MPVTEFVQLQVPNEGSSDSVSRRWRCKGTNLTPTEVLNAAEMTTDSVVDGLPRQGHDFEEIATNEIYFVTANYGVESPSKREQSGAEAIFNFSDSTELTNVKTALEEMEFAAGDGIAVADLPNFHDAIGVQGLGLDRTIEGTEIYQPVSGFSYEFTNDQAFFTDAKRREITLLRATVNNAPFKGYAKGEVLFLGSSGRVSSQGPSSIGLNFAVRENINIAADGSYSRAGINYPGPFTVAGIDIAGPVTLEGWWHTDVYRETQYDDAGAKVEEKVILIRWLRNYYYGDFDLLGIP